MTKTYKGLEADLKAKQCGRCKGEGTLEECTVDQFPLTCPDCNGTGITQSKFEKFWKDYTMGTDMTFDVSKSIAKGIFNAGAKSK